MNFEYSPFDRVFTNNPYPFYAEMRADHPVHHWVRSDIWTICTYDAVSAALRNVKAFSSRAMAEILMGKMPGERGSANSTRSSVVVPTREEVRGAIVYADPPVHTALRKIANRGFMPDMMKALEVTAEIAVDEMLARVKHRDSFDVIEDFGLELPIRMIAALLGVEAHNYSDMRKAADAVVQGMNGSKRHLGPEASGLNDGNRALKRIIRESVKARIANPDVGLISRLLSASEDGALTPDEVVGFGNVLIFAGSETTTHMIGNTIHALIQDRNALNRVADDISQIPKAIDESMRWDGPVQYVFRRALEDVEVEGKTIPAGATVCVLLGSANRDEARWGSDAAAFDLDRRTTGHIAYGVGTHFCLGIPLAKMETLAALKKLVPMVRNAIAPAQDAEVIDSMQFRGYKSLLFKNRESATT